MINNKNICIKLCNLFFCLLFINNVINFKSLIAENVGVNNKENAIPKKEDSTMEDSNIEINSETTISTVILLGAICYHLSQGLSVDEIAEELGKAGLCRNGVKNVAQIVSQILNREATRGKIPNIIIDRNNSKQSEEFYAKKNFKDKLKIIAATTAVIVTGIFLFKWWDWKFPGFFKNSENLPTSSPDQSVTPLDCQNNYPTKSVQPKNKKGQNQKKSTTHAKQVQSATYDVREASFNTAYLVKELEERMKKSQPLIERIERERKAKQAKKTAKLEHTNKLITTHRSCFR